jgi:PKD repeat protein
MKKRLFSIFFFLLTYSALLAQCPTVSITTTGSVCSAASVGITGNTSGGIYFDWDFCAGDFENPVLDTTSTDMNGLLLTSAGVAALSDSTGDYLFVCSRDNSKLLRQDFSNGFDNPPTAVTDLGNLNGTIFSANAIAFFNDGGIWHCLVSDIFLNVVTRLDFGNGLNNLPTGTTSVITTGLNAPRGIKIVREGNGTVYALIANFANNSISIFSFGTTIANAPTLVTTLQVPNANGLIDLDIIRDCDHWYAVACMYSLPDLVLIDLGNSLSSPSPVYSTYVNGMFYPYGIKLLYDGGQFYSFCSNSLGSINVHRLGAQLSTPSVLSLPSISIGGGPLSGIDFCKKNSKYYCFTPIESVHRVKLIQFAEPCNVSSAQSTDSIPANLLFPVGGNYLVTLGVTDSNGNVGRDSLLLAVNATPETNFSFSGRCLGYPTQFQNSTTISNGSISGYLWDFGTGDTSSVSDPQFTFTALNNFQISLTATSSEGCSLQFDSLITIAPLPSAQFTVTGGCSESLLPIVDLSTVGTGSISAWLWDFGNGDTSSASLPSYAYSTGGNFTMSLQVTTDAGCKDTITQLITVLDRPVGMIEVTNTCIGQPVNFLDLTTVSGTTIISRQWEFGDGDTSSSSIVAHTYATIGNYPLQFIIAAANGCVDTVSQDLRISDIPIAGFSYQAGPLCDGNGIQFTDLSSVAVGDSIFKWYWDFGDSTTSNQQHPIHRFDTAGTFTVKLVAYSLTSCPSIVFSLPITILESPVADFATSITCLGSDMQFTDQSSAPTGFSIDSVFWDFGNGLTSSQLSPVVNYSAAGRYSAVQSVYASNGCSAIDTQSVFVYAPPVAQYTTSLPCSDQAVNFTNTSTTDSASVISAYFWNFGDFNSGNQNTSTLANPSHIFSGQSGYAVFLIATSNFGCTDTFYTTLNILPAAPVQFTYSPTCFGDLMEFFNPGSTLDSVYQWNFGDNQTSQLREPAHFYAFPGNYTATLAVTAANGCVTTAIRTVTVSPIPIADFSTSPACVGTPYTLTNLSSISSGSIVSNEWKINGNNISSAISPDYTFQDTGNYTVRLTVISDIGCFDDIDRILRVYPVPEASFSFDPQFGNPPLAVTFTDNSINATSYEWNFGDGSPSAFGNNPVHTYQDTGFYFIREIVTSAVGCKDTMISSIYVIRPILDIAILSDSSYRSGNYFYAVALIANLGTRIIDSVSMEARIENGSTIREKLVRRIPNGPEGIQLYYFTASFYLSDPAAPVYYCLKADLPNGAPDDQPDNNEKCFNRSGEFLMTTYPNPATDQLTIDIVLPSREEITVDLYSQTGQLIKKVFSGTAETGLTRLDVTVAELSGGFYYLRARYRERDFSQPFIKTQP